MGTRLVFRLIYPDAKAIANANAPANFITRDIGSVVLGHDRPGVADYDSIMSGEDPDNRNSSYDYMDVDESSRDDRFLNEDVEARLGGASSKFGSAPGASAVSDDGNMTLNEVKFVIGDYISVTILPPDSDGSITDAPIQRPQLRKNIDTGFGVDGPAPPGRRRRGGRGRAPKNFSSSNSIPIGDWRRGERVPDPPRGGGGSGGGGRRGSRW